MSLMSQAIKDAVFEAIHKSSFDVSLPPLSDATWAKLLGDSARLERDRLEFVGDALMYATIGTVLYQQIPNGTPHMYTVRPASLLPQGMAQHQTETPRSPAF